LLFGWFLENNNKHLLLVNPQKAQNSKHNLGISSMHFSPEIHPAFLEIIVIVNILLFAEYDITSQVSDLGITLHTSREHCDTVLFHIL